MEDFKKGELEGWIYVGKPINAKVLDVGCGEYPRGHINIDLHKPKNIHGINFVKADAHCLPFPDNSFDFVFSNAVLEHVDNPVMMLRECLRVTKSKVEIRVPHRYWRQGLSLSYGSSKIHKNRFNVQWFRKFLHGYAHDISVDWVGKPFRVVPLFLFPSIITVTIYK